MENRLVKLKMDDTKNEEDIKKEMVEIESECVSKTVFFSINIYLQRGRSGTFVLNFIKFTFRRII